MKVTHEGALSFAKKLLLQMYSTLGATYEGTLRKHMHLANGYVRDTVVFSIIDSEWPQVKEKLAIMLQRP
ncbi:GNAT family protein [Brevibacillus laterosporus]|uniref:GNAT family protein n=1 Tax=Brevibacillus laterosporus TaxID=1465 RepID=UPI001E14626C|nr:GNAT family protein [Brevibacillus laterosporus]MBM7108353.1 hypothetical protein [Brevibacillus laterosporus]